MGMNGEIPLFSFHEVNMVQILQLSSYIRRSEDLVKVAMIFINAVEN
jgi:hypothetical protein